jgi:hypothetical protein
MKYEIKHKITGAVIWATEIKNINGADLNGADLNGANLSGANLRDANLRCANLSGADLGGADLGGADLNGANLSGANLNGANLRCANLRCANLRCANLRCANLSGANLSGADLSGADLNGANLSGANLRDADIEKLITQRSIVAEGDLIVWKKISSGVCKLLIPKEAARVGGVVGRKCRAEYAVVLTGSGSSKYDPTFVYTPGSKVRPDKWDNNPLIECSPGIHFFLTKHEAKNYK